MKWMPVFVIASLLAAAPVLIPPAAAQASGPMVRAGAVEKISAHIYAIPDNGAPGVPNVGFIVGSAGILVIDTGMGAPNGAIVLTEARKLGGDRKIHLVTTHVHPEHDLGAQAFPDTAVMIRSEAQVNEIAEAGMRTADVFRARSETNRTLLEGAAFRAADVTFSDAYDLDLGGLTVRLLSGGPSHTPGDTAIWVEADGVLFSGDLAMSALPAFASPQSSAKQWLTSLAMLDALKPKVVVPSHGPIGDAGYIAAYRSYLTRIQSRAADLKRQGKTIDDAVAAITEELKPDYPNTTRAAGAIRAAYAEAN